MIKSPSHQHFKKYTGATILLKKMLIIIPKLEAFVL
jgi:hypothetical protein